MQIGRILFDPSLHECASILFGLETHTHTSQDNTNRQRLQQIILNMLYFVLLGQVWIVDGKA